MHHGNEHLKIGILSTSEKEITDIIKAWLAISLAFGIILAGSVFNSGLYIKFIIAALTVGVGFLLHELGHKIVAQKHGCFAEFRSFDNMLVLAVLMSFLGFVFAAPGAVMISGRVSRKSNGLISAAGPLINIGLAIFFLAIAMAHPQNMLKEIAAYGFIINSWLALFNMIPFWLFDGYKILKWSKLAYAGIAGAAILLMISRIWVFGG